MIANTLVLVALAVVGIAAAPSSVAATPALEELEPLRLPGGFRYPNGIAAAPDGALFVGSLEGQVVRITADGRASVALGPEAGLSAVTSLRYDARRGRMLGATSDVSRLTGREPPPGGPVHRTFEFDPADPRATLRLTPVPDGGFANDLAVAADGAAYLTDSLLDRVLVRGPGEDDFVPLLADPAFAPGQLGPAGIATLPDGGLIVGLFSDGALLRLDPHADPPRAEPLTLSRAIENPDGIAALPGGRGLIVLEGAVGSGEGRVLHVALPDAGAGVAPVTELARGLHAPVNLTLVGDVLHVTESNARNLLRPDLELPEPEAFLVRRYRLAPAEP